MANRGLKLAQLDVAGRKSSPSEAKALLGPAGSSSNNDKLRSRSAARPPRGLTPDGDDRPNEIIANFLYMGSDDAATNLAELQRCGITHVLNMATECRNHFESIPGIQITYCRAELQDNPFEEFYAFIPTGVLFLDSVFMAQLRGKAAVLVHCAAGISRSSAMVVAYLMYKHGYRLDAATQVVRSKRKAANITTFKLQLEEFERFLDVKGHYAAAEAAMRRGTVFIPQPLPRILPTIRRDDRPPPTANGYSVSPNQQTLFANQQPQLIQSRGQVYQVQPQLYLNDREQLMCPTNTSNNPRVSPNQLSLFESNSSVQTQRISLSSPQPSWSSVNPGPVDPRLLLVQSDRDQSSTPNPMNITDTPDATPFDTPHHSFQTPNPKETPTGVTPGHVTVNTPGATPGQECCVIL